MGILLEYNKNKMPQFKYFDTDADVKDFIKENVLTDVKLFEDTEFDQAQLDKVENDIIKDLVYWVSNKDIKNVIKDPDTNSITFVVDDEKQIEDMMNAVKSGETVDGVDNGLVYEDTPIVFVSEKNKSKRDFTISKLNNHIEQSKPQEEEPVEEPTDEPEEESVEEVDVDLKTGYETLINDYKTGTSPILNDDNLTGDKIVLSKDSVDISVADETSQDLVIQMLNKAGLEKGKEVVVKNDSVTIGTNRYNVSIVEEEMTEEETKEALDEKYSKDNILEYLKQSIQPNQLVNGNKETDIISKDDKLITVYAIDEKSKKAIMGDIVKDYKEMSALSLKNGNGVAIYDNIITVIEPSQFDDEDKITKQLTKDLQQNMNDMYKSAIDKGMNIGNQVADELEVQN